MYLPLFVYFLIAVIVFLAIFSLGYQANRGDPKVALLIGFAWPYFLLVFFFAGRSKN